MSQACTIVNDALEFLNVSSGIMPADPGQQKRAFNSLVRLMDRLPTMNIYLELRRPASVNADIREPLWATEGLAIMLAYHSAPYFDAELSGHKLELYSEMLNEFRRRTGKPVRTNYPETLPLGAGNQICGSFYNYYYEGDDQYKYTLFDQRKVGEAKIYQLDFSSEASRRGTTVSTVVWSNIGEEDAVISGETVSGSAAEALVSFGEIPGEIIIRARCAFANGEIYDGILKVSLIDPESIFTDADHG